MYDFIVNVQVAVFRDGKYLFIVRGDEEEYMPGAKGLPGGKAEHGDIDNLALESTGKREIEEETGVTLAPSLHYVRSNVFGNSVMNVLLLGKWESGEPRARSTGEVAECMWLSADEVASDGSIPEWEKQHIRLAEAVRNQLGW